MAAPSGERKQQQQVEEEAHAARCRQPPPCGTAGAAPERPPDGGQVWRRCGSGVGGERSRSAAALSLRSLRLCQSLLSRLLHWFAARPLGQHALQGAAHTLAAAERAVAWAGGATAHCPVPFAWFFMMPIVMALMVVKIGADLAERYLDIELPDNIELVKWLEGQRVELERIRAVAAQNIRTQAVDQQDPLLGFLNRWPFNIPYRVAQQLGVVPVQVDQLTPPPESAGDKSLYFSPEAHKTAMEQAESEAQQDNMQEEAAGEKAQEGKLTPPPESAGDKSMYFISEADKTAKEQTESEAQQDNTQEEAEGEKAQEEKVKEQSVVAAAEEASAMAAQRDQPRDYVPGYAALPEHLAADPQMVKRRAALRYREWLKRKDSVMPSYSEWLRQREEEDERHLKELEEMRQALDARRSSETPQEGQSMEAEHSRDMPEEVQSMEGEQSKDMRERQQRTPSPKRNKKSFWDVFR